MTYFTRKTMIWENGLPASCSAEIHMSTAIIKTAQLKLGEHLFCLSMLRTIQEVDQEPSALT